MPLLFLNPAALVLLALAGVPLIVHLLVKRPSRRVLFPTLQFIAPGESRAARLRRLADWPLLMVRTLVLALVALALGGPVIVTPMRVQAWEQRVARLVVIDRSESVLPRIEAARGLARIEADGAFVSRVVESPDVLRAMQQASHAFAEFPPARRELVIVSDFQEGVVDPAAIAALPEWVGIRFVRVSGGRQGAPSAAGLPEVIAPEAESGAVRRALAAVAAANGLSASARDTRVIVGVRGLPRVHEMTTRAGAIGARWMAEVVHAANAMDAVSAGEHRVEAYAVGGRLLIVTDAAPSSFAFPALLDAIVRGLASERAAREARLPGVSDEQLAAWQRAPGHVPAESVQRTTETDARWAWLLVGLLLGAEGRLRGRSRETPAPAPGAERAA
jgi:hypothetical protein